MEILESRGLMITDREDAVRTLLSWNYYMLVNGCKDMFLNPAKSREAHDDRYVEGAYFEQLKLAYAFDRSFRSATMNVLMQAESVMKMSLVHAFCQKYSVLELADNEMLSKGVEALTAYLEGSRFHFERTPKRMVAPFKTAESKEER